MKDKSPMPPANVLKMVLKVLPTTFIVSAIILSIDI